MKLVSVSKQDWELISYALKSLYFTLEFDREYTGKEWAEIIRRDYDNCRNSARLIGECIEVVQRTNGALNFKFVEELYICSEDSTRV